MLETQRKRRGHAFLPPKAILRRVPLLYDTDSTPAEDKMIWIHYFAAGSDYWIAELDSVACEAYGYARHAHHPEGAEWGYICLPDLEQISLPGRINDRRVPGLIIIERDMHWTPCKFSEIKEAH